MNHLLRIYGIVSIVNDVFMVLREIRRQTPRYTKEEKQRINEEYEKMMRSKRTRT